MPVEYAFETDPYRVEFKVSASLTAAEIVASLWKAARDPRWKSGTRSLWEIPSEVDMSALDLESFQRDVLPEVPALRAKWVETFRDAWIIEGQINPLVFEMWKSLPEAVHTRRFPDRGSALDWLSETVRP